MEAELDLRPYFLALVRRWWLIALATIGIALVAIVVTGATPPARQASADLIVIPASNQIVLDPRFVTSDEARVSNPTLQREGMIALATSNTLEALARANLPTELAADYDAPNELLAAIKVTTQGDLLMITASAGSDETARVLAETWARSYQQLIDQLYNGGSRLNEELAAGLSEAETRYSEAQQQLEDFIAQSNLPELEQRVRNLQTLLTNAADADQKLYRDYLDRVRELDLVIADARTLRDQLAGGNSDALGNALALLALRARTAGTQDLPFELRFDDPELLSRNAPVTTENIDELIAVLLARRTDLLDQAQGLARSLAAGDGDLIGLSSQVRTRYMQDFSELVRQQEAQLSQQRLLEQRRDIAFESLKLLQSKSDEQQIARSSPQVEVRLINTSLEQPASLGRRVLLSGVIGAFVGLFLSMLLVLIIDILRPALRNYRATARAGSQSEGAAAD